MKFTDIFANAEWVTCSPECTSPLIRGKFVISSPEKAEITICGLGFFRLWINGHEVSEDKLVPVASQYCERDTKSFGYPVNDTLSYRTYAVRYDISHLVVDGENDIRVILGCGWFSQKRRNAEGNTSYGDIKLCYKIDISDTLSNTHHFVSDKKLEWRQSRIIDNNIYHGETHDMSLADELTASSGFEPVLPAPCHESEFYIQDCPADRVVRTITPKKLCDIGEYSIYDMGENISGYPVITAIEDNADILVRCSEELNSDMTLNFDSCGWDRQIQQDRYINVKNGDECMPWFTWHGFRYFELSRNAEPLRCEVVNSDCAVTSSFECDNDILNTLYTAYIRTQLSNMHSGVPSDCPHIERLGYTGDGQLCCESAMMLTDSRRFYRKWLEDISDCQDIHSGHVQHTAPFMGGGGGPAGWGGAIVIVPYIYYKMYGDRTVLNRFLPKMLKYFDYLDSRSCCDIVWREEDGGWCLGDWCPPEDIAICEPFVNTALYAKQLMIAAEIAEILGENAIARELTEKCEDKKAALCRAYYSPQTQQFIGNVQGADSFALDIGLGTKKTEEKLVKKYSCANCYDTGIFATDILTRILFERGYQDTAFNLLTSTGKGSFYNMFKQGATTLWENWDGERSHSHPMFGAVTRYLFSFILGITQEHASAGYEKILIAPEIPEKLGSASGYITTVQGKISVSFVKSDKKISFDITVPKSAKFVFNENEYVLQSGENHFEF